MDGLDAMAIDQARYFNTAIRQVINQAGVAHIAINDRRAMKRDSLDNKGPVLVTALIGNLTCAAKHFIDLPLVVGAPGRPVIGVKASASQIAFATILLNQLRTFAKVRHIFRKMAPANSRPAASRFPGRCDKGQRHASLSWSMLPASEWTWDWYN